MQISFSLTTRWNGQTENRVTNVIGSLISGRYRIDRKIGAGGMGVVYAAHDNLLQRDVAIKVIQPHLVEDSSARNRFLKEAQSVAGLVHPNIVIVYDLLVDDPGQEVYIIMELLSGVSLREAENSSDTPSFLSVASQVTSALNAAHTHGILHRDIKPQNIFICDDGTIKLMDFGLACLLSSSTRTQSGMMAGTIGYIAPEQLKDLPVDERSDLYSLGIVLYELLTGAIPFASDNPGAMLVKRLTSEPKPIQELVPNLDSQIAYSVMSLLHSDPHKRPCSAAQFASLLEPISNMQNISITNQTELMPSLQNQTSKTTAGSPKKTRISPSIWLSAGGVMLTGAVVVLILIGVLSTPRKVGAHSSAFNNFIAAPHIVHPVSLKVKPKEVITHSPIKYYKVSDLDSRKLQAELNQQSREIQQLQNQLKQTQLKADQTHVSHFPDLISYGNSNKTHFDHKVGFFHVQMVPESALSPDKRIKLIVSAKEPHYLACYVYRPRLEIATRERISPNHIDVMNGNSTMINLVNKSHLPFRSMLIILGSPDAMHGLPEALTMGPLLHKSGNANPIRSAGKLILEELMPSLKVSHLDIRFVRYQHSGNYPESRKRLHNAYRAADATMLGPSEAK